MILLCAVGGKLRSSYVLLGEMEAENFLCCRVCGVVMCVVFVFVCMWLGGGIIVL